MKKSSRLLTKEDYNLIKQIAREASEQSNLDFEKCYTITLLYFLYQFGGMEDNELPVQYIPTVKLLYKNFYGSYIHYITEILYSDDEYAKAIKNAEIALNGGDDPRCPW